MTSKSVAHNKTRQIWSEICRLYQRKGRGTIPKKMNFRKSSKDFGPLNSAFWSTFPKKIITWSSKNGNVCMWGGGLWNFYEKSSVLISSPVPPSKHLPTGFRLTPFSQSVLSKERYIIWRTPLSSALPLQTYFDPERRWGIIVDDDVFKSAFECKNVTMVLP